MYKCQVYSSINFHKVKRLTWTLSSLENRTLAPKVPTPTEICASNNHCPLLFSLKSILSSTTIDQFCLFLNLIIIKPYNILYLVSFAQNDVCEIHLVACGFNHFCCFEFFVSIYCISVSRYWNWLDHSIADTILHCT